MSGDVVKPAPGPGVSGDSAPHGLLGRAGRGSVLNLAGAAVSASAAFALTILLTRALSRSDAGVFFSATALFLLVTSLGQLGTSTGLVYFLSRGKAQGAVNRSPAVMRTAMRPVLVVAFVMGGLLLLFAHPVAEVMGPGHVDDFTSYLRALALFIPLAALANVSLSGTRGLGTMRPNAMLDQMGRPLLQLVLVALVVALSADQLVVWAWGIAYLPLGILAWLAFRRICRRQPVPAGETPPPPTLATFWRFTAPRAVSSVAQVAMQRLDIILVGALAGLAQAAVYAAATRFLALGQLAGGAISQAVQPHLGAALVKEDRTEVGELYKISTGWLVALTWPLYLVFIVFAPTILSVFGGGYAEGSNVLILLSLSMLIATGCGMVDMVLLMAGRTSWNLYNVLAAFAVNLSLDLVLIPRQGILGAAIGWAAAILVANLLPLVEVTMSVRVHPFGPASVTAMVLGIGCFVVIPGGARLLGGAGWGVALLSLGIGGLCYLVGLWRFRGRLRLAALTSFRRPSATPSLRTTTTSD